MVYYKGVIQDSSQYLVLELEKHLHDAHLHPDDAAIIRSVFPVLSSQRQYEVIEQWECIVQKITQRRAIVEEEITLILGENTSYLQARRRWETQKRIFELRFGEPL
jgi:hypothetical protein